MFKYTVRYLHSLCCETSLPDFFYLVNLKLCPHEQRPSTPAAGRRGFTFCFGVWLHQTLHVSGLTQYLFVLL